MKDGKPGKLGPLVKQGKGEKHMYVLHELESCVAMVLTHPRGS